MSAVDRVTAAYASIDQADRPEVWITLRPAAEALAEAAAIDAAMLAGEELPLAGLVAAVKDNIDVAGLPTTAGAPSYEYLPALDATSVARLRAAGAVVLGKTNLDQFATGLVGTRSPYGAVRNAWNPARISGGSSAGSAVAVALGLVDFALGTDTAGSGRVPAALNGIVGVKPTRGVIPCTGVVPACRSLDCVTVFARSLPLARRAVAVMAGPDDVDPLATLLGSRPRGGWRPRSADAGADAGRARIAVPLPAQLAGLADGWAEAFQAAVARLQAVGAEVTGVDIAPLLEAASLLYGGSFVAERYTAVGNHVRENARLIGGDLDPVVAATILSARKLSAADYFADAERLDRLAARAADALDGYDALLTPTTALHPTIADVRGDPVGINARLGTYTNFANLLDLAALAVPAGTVAGLPFGIMLTGPAGSDAVLAEIAARCDQADVDLLVVGAHLTGQPLNHELLAAGGSLLGPAATAPAYRLYALNTQPPKPGLVRVESRPSANADAAAPGQAGASITGELWRLPAAGFSRFMTGLAVPMAIGRVRLDDGRDVLGFLCEAVAVRGAADITRFGGWRSWIGRRAGV
ncbi:MAG TPA: allophanate hydrolase [Trebonia sp.]|nr:allophanate hydrolase [Trebonia sp.]